MALHLKLMYSLVVISLQSVYSDVGDQGNDYCQKTRFTYNTRFGENGFLTPDQQVQLDIEDILLYQDNLPCQTPVSSNCFQCEGPAALFCNVTTSEDLEYLKNSQTIPHLYLNLDYIEETTPQEIFDELNINTLELIGNNLTKTNLGFINGIKNLSTLVLRGQLEEDSYMAELLTDMKNLTNLIMDLTEVPNDGEDLTPPDNPGRRHGLLGPDIPENPTISNDLNLLENTYNKNYHNYFKGQGLFRIPDTQQGIDDILAPGSSENSESHNGYGDLLQMAQTKHLNDGTQTNKSNYHEYGKVQHIDNSTQLINTDRDNMLPNLRIYGLIAGKTTLIPMWIGKSPIEYLYFHKCNIYLDNFTGLLARLQTSLKYLDIDDSFLHSDSNIELIDGIQYALNDLLWAIKDTENRTILKGLAATNMNLKCVPFDALTTVKDSLEYLSLNGNDFSMVGNHVISGNITPDETSALIFPKMTQLLELDLRSCNIVILESGAFKNLPNLKVLLLSQNHIYSYNAECFRNLYNLQYLDLSLNDNSGTSNGIEKVNFTYIPKLEILDISQTNLYASFTFCGELRNLKKLSLCNTFSVEVDSNFQIFDTMPSLKLLNLSGNKFKGGIIDIKYFSGLESLEKLYLVNCFLNFVGMNTLNASMSDQLISQPLKSLKLLDMSQNQLSFLHKSDFVFLTNLEFLILEQSGIQNWRLPIFSNLTYLKYVNLNNNFLTSITSAMLEDFRHLQRLSLKGNQFKCDCELIDFVTMVYEKADKNTFLNGWLDNKYVCADEMSSLSIPFSDYKDKDCNNTVSPLFTVKPYSSYTFVIYLIAAVCIFLITISMITYYKWHDIRYFALIIKDATILSFFSDNKDLARKDRLYNYDVFVSYSDPNRNWVLDELIPNLEMSGNLKVCLHERDFQIGLSILENIISCMDNSKCIMLIISLSFIKSNWCQFELHLAQHRLLETKREHLILVLLEDVPHYKRSKMLNFLMKTKTYIVWPPSEEDHEARKHFWKRLRQAVVFKTKVRDENISLA